MSVYPPTPISVPDPSAVPVLHERWFVGGINRQRQHDPKREINNSISLIHRRSTPASERLNDSRSSWYNKKERQTFSRVRILTNNFTHQFLE